MRQKIAIFDNFNEIFEIFSNFEKIYRIFRENLVKNLENLEVCIGRGRSPRTPSKCKFIKNLVEKSTETGNF